MKTETYTYYKQALAQAEQQMRKLETQGSNALSRYDIEIAHGGDKDAAVRTAKMLVANHVRYFAKKLAALQPEVIQPSLFDKGKEVRV